MDVVMADAIKAALGDYLKVRQSYYDEIFVAVYDYLDTGGSVATFKNAMKRAMVDALLPASESGWLDGGGELPIDEDTSAWVTAMQGAELSNIDVLFETLKQLKKTDEEINRVDTATARANGYCLTMDTVYSHCKLAAGGNIMLTLEGTDGAVSCAECQKYKGKRHKASWWIANNLVPGVGSAYTCGGWNCYHVLVDDKGKLWTI
jgi:hypothetical protein